ncbi:MAG TPA: hypothetical protein VK642_10980 [Burkholderiales bacterium]|nr:hypothetical protein [Burkholderiales bacterium]
MTLPSKLSVEQDQFLEIVRGEDELGVVIRSHIYVESALVYLLKQLVTNSAFLDRLDLDYAQRVNLAVALGLKAGHAPPLLALGTIRNTFAHKLDTKLTKDKVDSLYKQFSPSDKEILHASFKQTMSKVSSIGVDDLRKLPPKDQFALLAIALRSLLLTAITELEANANA